MEYTEFITLPDDWLDDQFGILISLIDMAEDQQAAASGPGPKAAMARQKLDSMNQVIAGHVPVVALQGKSLVTAAAV